jgi:very-short-patch-repair endonuclease
VREGAPRHTIRSPFSSASVACRGNLGFILDFYCAEHRIAIEVDGDSHLSENAEYDLWRDSILSEWRIHVLRVSGATALHHAEFVERDLIRAIDRILEG